MNNKGLINTGNINAKVLIIDNKMQINKRTKTTTTK